MYLVVQNHQNKTRRADTWSRTHDTAQVTQCRRVKGAGQAVPTLELDCRWEWKRRGDTTSGRHIGSRRREHAEEKQKEKQKKKELHEDSDRGVRGHHTVSSKHVSLQCCLLTAALVQPDSLCRMHLLWKKQKTKDKAYNRVHLLPSLGGGSHAVRQAKKINKHITLAGQRKKGRRRGQSAEQK